MANRKQTKRELKQQKAAAREAARRAERRRTLITAGIVAVVVVSGLGLVGLTLFQDSRATAEQERQAAQAASEAARQASEEAEALANRAVACGASEPATATASEQRPTFTEAEQVLKDNTDYSAVIDTSCGQVVIDLAEQDAPETVNSFVFLAQQGFYDGLEIFRNAATIGALQTGSGTNDASWQLGYTLPDELALAEAEGYGPGAVAMANAGPNTGGSQFFFVYNDKFSLDPTFTRFGTVAEGLDVLERIGEIKTIGAQGETPSELVYINSVEIREAEGARSQMSAPSESASSQPQPSESE